MIRALLCLLGRHRDLVRDRVQGVPVWRCPLCWRVRQRTVGYVPVAPQLARVVRRRRLRLIAGGSKDHWLRL